MDAAALARAYYRRIDDGTYDALREVLADSFVHDRPDRTLEGPDQFVQFMREGRPLTNTTHVISIACADDSTAVAEGVLEDGDGGQLFAFVDVFECADDTITEIRTYTD